MLGPFANLAELAGRTRVALLAVLTGVMALTEGVGLVLLVPLVASLDEDRTLVELPIDLPDWPLVTMLAIFVLLVAARAMADVARSLLAQRIEVAVVDGLRGRAMRALLGAEWRALAAMHQSANRALIITSIDRVGEAVYYFTTLLRTGLALGALALAAVALSPMVALGGTAAALGALFALRRSRADARRLGEELSRRYEAIHARLEASLAGLRLIKSFGREEAEARRLSTTFKRMRSAEYAYIRGAAIARAILQLAAACVLALLIWLAVTRWDVSTAILLAFVALAVRAVPLVEALQISAQGWNQAAPALAEARELIVRAEAQAEMPPIGNTPRLRGSIALEHASFAHDRERRALQDISLEISRGSIAALTGPSGAGKSTVADLLGGLISPDSGTVLIDGMTIEGGARQAWRSRVAYVQQDPVLFSGSVRDNLLWAEPGAEEKQLSDALRRASADFVHDLPGGIDCQIGEAGRALSGGERQRIALARALLREPDLLILDEATSSVDPASEDKIAEAVAGLAGACTVLVIGHRGRLAEIASLRFALEKGRLQPS